jgi:hypothetical protein
MECKQEFPEERFKNLINYPYGQWSYAISPAQIQYFRECLKVSEESEAVLVACSCPIPLETRRIITDYEKNQKEITSLMRTMGVKYVDFNDSLVLETKTHYFDELHLNQQGVEKFNDALILWLQQEKLL